MRQSCVSAEQPEPGPQHHLVARHPLLELDQAELADQPVEPALRVARLGLDRQRLVDERVRLDVELGAGQADGELEAAADLVEARRWVKVSVSPPAVSIVMARSSGITNSPPMKLRPDGRRADQKLRGPGPDG